MRSIIVLFLSTLLFGCATGVPGLIGANDLKLGDELRAQVAAIARKAGPNQPIDANAVLYLRARGNFGGVNTYDQRSQWVGTGDGLTEEVRSIVPRDKRAAPEFERSLSLCGLVELLSESSATPPRSEITFVPTASTAIPIVTGGGLPSGGRYLASAFQVDHPSPCTPQLGDSISVTKQGQLLRRVIGPIGTIQRLQDVEEKMRCTVGPGVNKDVSPIREDDLFQVTCKHESSIGWPIASTFAYLRSSHQYIPLLTIRAEGTDIRFQYTSIR